MPELYKNYIGGKWVEGRSGKTFENRSPANYHDLIGIFPASGPEDVRPEEVRPREGKGHRVLELVPEAEGASRLIEAGPRPEPAAQVLVQEPAVHQEIEGVVRGAHLDRLQRLGPELSYRFEGAIRGGHAAMAHHQLAGMLAMARGARIYDGPDEVHRMVVARRILKSFADGGAWRFE